jgi:hypothetical protein
VIAKPERGQQREHDERDHHYQQGLAGFRVLGHCRLKKLGRSSGRTKRFQSHVSFFDWNAFAFRMEQVSIDFATQENSECCPIQPDHERNSGGKGSIGLVRCCNGT